MKESKAPSLGRTPAQKFLDKWQGLIYLIPWIIGFIVFKAMLARGYAALESRESPQGTVLALYPV